jgi:DNA-binding MarR family transcriptional regulator
MGASQIYSTTVNAILERTLEEAGGNQLALSQLKLLMLISPAHHRFKVSDVAKLLGVSNAAASRAIDRLVQRGLVDRSIAPDNRRAVDLDLTADGRTLLRSFNAIRDQELMRLLGDYSEDKLKKVAHMLDELSVLLMNLDQESEDECLRCDAHFRSGCVLRDVLGKECMVGSRIFAAARES